MSLPKLPDVTVTQDTTGDYRVVATISGLAPGRSVTGEELLEGIESLNPPTIVAGTIAEAKLRIMRACLNAIDATDGQALTPSSISFLCFFLGVAVSNAFVAAGFDG